MRRVKKSALLALVSGTSLFAGLGCLGGEAWKWVWQGAAAATGGALVDTFVWDNVLLGQHVSNGVAYSNAIFAACDGIEDATDRANCFGGLAARP